MHRRYLICSLLILVTVMISSCQFGWSRNEDPSELALAWQANVDQLRELLRSERIPDHLLIEEPMLRGDEFDVMAVFDVLDRISMAEGYKLAYVYRYDYMGGSPLLYVQPADSPPYASLGEYREARAECFGSGEKPPDCDPMQYVGTDGSELGYLQWTLLSMMGGQFYLHWHANYNDVTAVATEEAMESILTRMSGEFIPLDLGQKIAVKRIDPTPEVTIGADTVSVRAVWFTKFGGFFETRQTLSRGSPQTILESETDKLLDYECGLMY